MFETLPRAPLIAVLFGRLSGGVSTVRECYILLFQIYRRIAFLPRRKKRRGSNETCDFRMSSCGSYLWSITGLNFSVKKLLKMVSSLPPKIIMNSLLFWIMIISAVSLSRFWSQIIYSSHSLDGLVSFLQEALPYYVLPEFLVTPRLEEAYHKTAESVFQAFIRLGVFDSKVCTFINRKLFL